ATRIVDVENDQIRPPISADVRKGDSCPLVLGAKPARHSFDIAPSTCNVAACIQIPTDAVITVILATRIVDMENDQIRPATTAEVRNNDPRPLILGTEPAGHGFDIAPSTQDVSVGIQVPTNAVMTMILATRIVDMENDQIRSAISAEVRNSDPRSLIFSTEPARYGFDIAPSARDISVRVQVPTDAVITVILATRIVDMEDDQIRSAV